MSKTDDTANSKPAFLDFLRPKRESVTEDEIKDMVAENIELLEDEKRMINDILDLADMTVREIMKPRVDMIMAEDTEPARAALDRMRGTGYSPPAGLSRGSGRGHRPRVLQRPHRPSAGRPH